MERRADEEAKVGGGYNEKPASGDELSSDEVPAHLRETSKRGILGTLRHYESILDKKLGVEAHAISRKKPEDRDPAFAKWHNQAVMFLLWMSSTMNLSCFATGFLGWELGLDLRRNIVIITFATFLGSAVTGWCATMGPGTGLRQVSISRYSIGWYPSKVIAVLNVVEQVGWSSVGSITGGLALSAVSDGKIGSELGVVIAAVLGFVISFVGLKAIFSYEKFAGIVLAIVFVIMYGEAAGSADLATDTALRGSVLSGTALTLFAVVYGSSASWCSIVADYYVEYPVDTSKWKVWILTTLGICLPTVLGMALGATVASALPHNASWNASYEKGIGFLIQDMIHPDGFAKFLLVILAFSGIAMNAVSLYSAGLSIQQFARPLGVIPRFFWTTLMFVAIILLALVGRDRLLVFLENFLSLLGYWNTSFFAIMCTEHYLFREALTHGFDKYNLDAWNTPGLLPTGFAGGLAFASGIAGCVVGMSETWYVGVLARMIGDPASGGGDIGNELVLVFTLVVYIPARWLEYRITKR
ncbi:putative nucleoside protein [Diplogelasinospora grovesii]|uniref:Nucleoside protein n=1 Tax=Diplogelasinospora grovesii TaxID=303347 RepID=A0AAN6NHI8_9PEZI|nr:putative nucleoside protein [Diplogelasinospora grovesii]